MGSLHASEFAGAVANGDVSLDTALAWHLSSNHYPPIPLTMVPTCKAAIEHATAGDWDAEVALPHGVTYRGKGTAPVHAIVAQHHLGAFIGEE